MSLTDTAIRSLKPKPTPNKVADEKGLFLLVTPAGGKLWKLKFRNGMGVEKKLALGAYQDLRLKDAREARDKARSALAKGVDPAEQKQSDRRAAKVNAANRFGVIAKAYIEKNRRDGKAEATVNKREWFLGLVDRAIGHSFAWRRWYGRNILPRRCRSWCRRWPGQRRPRCGFQPPDPIVRPARPGGRGGR